MSDKPLTKTQRDVLRLVADDKVWESDCFYDLYDSYRSDTGRKVNAIVDVLSARDLIRLQERRPGVLRRSWYLTEVGQAEIDRTKS